MVVLARAFEGIQIQPPVLDQQRRDIRDRKWMAEKVTLYGVASAGGKKRELSLCLHALRDSPHVQRSGHREDSSNQRHRVAAARQIGHERFVYLQHVDGK